MTTYSSVPSPELRELAKRLVVTLEKLEFRKPSTGTGLKANFVVIRAIVGPENQKVMKRAARSIASGMGLDIDITITHMHQSYTILQLTEAPR